MRLAERRYGETLSQHEAGINLGDASFLLISSFCRAVFVAHAPTALLLLPRDDLSALLELATVKSAREHQQATGWLREAPALHGCSAPLVSQLLKNSTRRTFAFGDRIARQGEHSHDLYLLCDGECVLTVAPRDGGQQLPLRHVGPGQILPCAPAQGDLQVGVHFVCSASVASSHATLLLLNCGFLGGVLQVTAM